jgi:hypothetical protein
MIAGKAIRLFWIICLLALYSITAFPQSQTTGRIAGTVKDPHGAVIVGAEVTVKSLATAEERKVTTDTEGNYSAPILSPGSYRVRITASGFNPALFDSVQVVITETTTVNAELTVAGVSAQAVTVSAAPLIQAVGPQLGRVVDSRAVSELPLATRNFLQILALSPGTFVALSDNTALGRNSQAVSVNGARPTQNNLEINGIDANSLIQNNSISVAVPAPETIQEFKIQTSLYDAAFGRGGGGNVQAVTRSGANEFHGAAYEYFRDDTFNANNPFLKAAGVERPVLKRSVFGGVFGGPVTTDRAFFFASYQGTRERNDASDNSLTSSVLIARGLTDDRSEQTLLATFRPRFPGSLLPATSVHPSALALLNTKLPDGRFLIPTPQADGRYSGSAISTYREDQFNANIDYRIRENDWLAVKFFFSKAPQFAALPNNAANVPGFGAVAKNDNRLFSVQNIHTFDAMTVNETRVGYSLVYSDSFGRHPVKDSDVGIKRANASAYPGLGIIRIGAAAVGTSNPDINALTIGNAGTNVDLKGDNSAITLVDILSLTRGRHSFRMGGGIIFYRTNVTTNINRRGQIVFQNFNNFLLGLAANSLNGEGINTRFLRTADYSLFLQDDWKLSQKLTLNLGMRYELNLPPYETRGAIGTFDPALYQPRMEVDASGNPVGPPAGGFVQAGNVISQYDLHDVPNVGKRVFTSVDPNNFGPRLGFAFSPFDTGRLTLRGGYGIFYSRPSTTHINNTINAPPTYAIRRSPPGELVRLEDPFVPLPSQDEFPKFVPGVALSSSTFDRRLRTAYFHQYNASFQYALSHNLLLEVAYVGTRGHNLFRNVRSNQAPLASTQQPIVNAVTGQVISTNTPANAILRAPYQGADIIGFQQFQYTAESAYNSLQMSLTRRLSRRLQLLASYTYAKSLDNASGMEGLDATTILGNQLDDRANRGVSDFDRTHRFVLSYLWDLPGPAFTSKSAVGRLLFSNWQVAAIITASPVGRLMLWIQPPAHFILGQTADSPGRAGHPARHAKRR